MAYGNRPADVVDPVVGNRIVEYHDRVRWGPIISGLLVALTTQLILSALGAAIGLSSLANSGAPRSNADDVGLGVGIWSIISLLIGLFVGGWVTSRASGPMNRNTALLNGAILWATALIIGSWLLANGVVGTFGIAASNAGEVINQAQQGGINVPNRAPNVSAQQARDIAGNAARVGWSFVFGSLLGLVASMIGASIGARNYNRTYQ
ncbi:hypothetical protein H6S82_27530 [Planktothrix sp. FACHB-1355]|uniref:PhnA-like protein n=1 Tax=Aerosakkonema funiforme FACHB-1375 TaxID=2949571 RepID=A0A926VIY9_9CYAN|nr:MULTISPECIES: hypothetical protein [Oscillatoriales]MBD2184712.1 hypothetical protein [Aerosakkonema funiforme FACHB-1375]MBD3562567.1 hypothetical protein [Planktothrix sp. FACHB-1355]